MKTVIHPRRKGLLLFCAVVSICSSFTNLGQSPPSVLIDFSNGSQVRLSWPNMPGNIVLEETDALTPTSVWQPFPQNPTLLNGQFSVAVDITGVSRFFRLRIIQPDDSPPDLASVAPPLPQGVVTALAEATEFLYTGPNPIQTGVTSGTIEAKRAAVLRGRVKQRDNTPLAGVTISILNHSEFGQTLSRTNGMFDLAVNGGGLLTVKYEKTGFCPVQRQINVPWQDYVMAKDVVMIQMDPIVTSVALGSNSPMQVHQGSMQTDADGSRHATLLFTPGTCGNLVLANGTTQACSSISVRATEFTVGANGPAAMPAALPATSAYTYCVELSADEAMAQGATAVQFDRPVFTYVENFLGFPIGMDVPLGSYDHRRGVWIPENNGKVIKILSVTGGMVDLDTDGDGLADSAAALAALSITDTERERLAALYKPGQSLWRAPVTHFTPFDYNWPIAPPPDAIQPPDDPEPDDPLDNCCELSGNSVIETENQVLGEAIGVVGTGFGLHYRSEWTPGYQAAYTLEIPLSNANLPASVQSIELEIEVAGRHFEQSFPATTNQRTTFTWDGKDAYGRTLDGAQPILVNISYTYKAVYVATSGFAAPPIPAGGAATLIPSRLEYKYTRIAPLFVGSFHPTSAGLGGWTLSPHHTYDPKSMALFRGDGRRESASAQDALGPIITRVAGTGSRSSAFSGDGGPATEAQVFPQGIAVGPDGSLYIASPFAKRVRRVGPDGIITTVAGNGVQCSSPTNACGDGGLATQAQLIQPYAVAIGADNTLFIGEVQPGYRIRKVDPSGIITTIAGTGVSGFSGDGGQASLAQITDPRSIAVGPDGALYIAEVRRIRRIGPDGIITTVAGGGPGCPTTPSCGDGGPATQAFLDSARSVAVGLDNSIYIAETGRIRQITPDGIIRTIAGGGRSTADGIPPTQAAISPTALAVGPDDTVFILNSSIFLRSFRPGGVINTLAGSVNGLPNGDGGPARRAIIDARGTGLALGPDGSVYFAERDNARDVRRVAPLAERSVAGELVVPARDGSEVFIFTPEGKHLRTVDALTGAVRYQFAYDVFGQLATIIDLSGNVTTIERDAKGLPSGILGPFGQRTLIETDTNGYLSQVTDPAGEAVQLGYGPGGLLAAFMKPGRQTATYGYDRLGRLIGATDPTGATKTLTRSGSNKDHTVTLTTALGRVSTFRTARADNQDLHLTTTDPAGAQSQLLIAQNGNQSSTARDGTKVSVDFGPDPRWGMRAPIPTNITVKTPNGLTRVTTMQRTVTLASPGAFLDLSTLTDTVTVNGRTFASEYSGSTRTLTYTWPTGRQQKLELDSKGRVLQGRLGNLEPASFTYDARGRFATLAAGSAGNSRITAFAYEANGFLASITDPLGRTLVLTNDSVGRITGATRPGGATVGLDYDVNGNITGITPPGRPSHVLAYTSRDEASSYTAPVVGREKTQTKVAYNADRQPTQVDRPDGQANTWEYDRSGRLSVGTLAGRQRTYAYDAASRLLSLNTSHGINLVRTYDGWLPTGTIWSGAVPGNVTQTYDNEFRVSEMKVNGANPIAIQYDKDGLPVQVGSLVLTRNAEVGLVTATKLGGVSDALTYDGFGDATSYAASHDSTALYSVTLGRDQLGRITSKNETIDGITHLFSYTYDIEGRLTEVQQDSVLIAKYAYDANGNRTSFSGANGTINAIYDAQDRLTQYGPATFTFTPNGELLRKTVATQITTYDYDGASKLTGLTLPDGKRIDYLLDGRGRRMGKKVNGALTQAFLYQDGLRPIAELDGTGTLVTRFVYAGGENVPAYMMKGGATYRIITDQIGSPRMVIDITTGQVKQRMDYDEFGVVRLDSNPGFQPFGFAGGLYDPLSELVHFGAREYDPETGRWTVKDPIGLSGGLNVYAYVDNDPVNFIDPAGANRYKGRWIGSDFKSPLAPPSNPNAPPPTSRPPPPATTPPPPPATAPPPRPVPLRPPPIGLPGPGEPLFRSPPEFVLPPGGGTGVPECPNPTILSRVGRVARYGGPVGLSFLGGYLAGTVLDQALGISDAASDKGVEAKLLFLERGASEEDANLGGAAVTALEISGFDWLVEWAVF
ncbi:MAG: hypothetical protein L0Z50_22400 [Verrucomicrobiales bacterium]|nr:hypothetical protein [Verrucomicrobiales bacterium]